MAINETLGQNIKKIRKAHGETQEELATALNCTSNAISNYESGIRRPELEILQAIASRYGYPVDHLIRADFSRLDFTNITFEWNKMVSMLDILFPFSVSDKALEEPFFNEGYRHSQKLRAVMQNGEETIHREVFEKTIEAFLKSLETSALKEAAANFLWVIFVFFSLIQVQDENSISMGRKILNGKVDGSKFIKDYVLKNLVDTDDEKREAQKSFARDFNECIVACMECLKESSEYANIADYYLALRYIIGLVDTEYGQQTNRIIGMEMMLSFLTLGNPYAFSYVKNAFEM